MPGIYLDVGSGAKRIEGYQYLDKVHCPGIDYACDAWNTPIPDGTVAHIRARHFLEHLTPKEVNATLIEWRRILEPKGTVWVAVPDLTYHAKQLLEPGHSEYLPHKTNFEHAIASIYGWESEREHMNHKWGYVPKTLKHRFIVAGFMNITLPPPERECDIILTARNQ